jgi:hypothetical protein
MVSPSDAKTPATVVADQTRKPRLKPRNCSVCGRFLRRDGKCPKVIWDYYNGAWEHE